MTKPEFVKELCERSEISKDKAMLVISSFEDLINEIIATNDKIRFSFGIIQGVTHLPKEIKGKVGYSSRVKANGGWSSCKLGFPNIIWSKEAKFSTKINPWEWFEYVENRYSDEAKEFRLHNNIPEPSMDEKREDLKKMPENVKEMVNNSTKKEKSDINPLKKYWENKRKEKEIK